MNLKIVMVKCEKSLHNHMRRTIASLILLILISTGPLTILSDVTPELPPEIEKKSETGAGAGVYDVPSWRIGDKWVYETKFDVAQLIQQANVQASLNTLTGDTTMEVVDIDYVDIEGVTTLVYEVDIEGEFSSGNNGATFDGLTGRLEIEYEGTDFVRASDLSVWDSEFTLFVRFLWLNLFPRTLADITFSTVYEPPREKYDFPLRKGDQWTSNYMSATNVSGDSDYFDVDTFSTPYLEDNTTYQATKEGSPIEDGDTISYTGCTDSIKVESTNNTGTPTGFEWYCPAVRSYAWSRIVNSAGFQIDWLLKTYNPAQSVGYTETSSPGYRNTVIEVEPEFVATLPDANESVYGYMYNTAGDIVNRNLQLRYEVQDLVLNPTTNSSGRVAEVINVGSIRDNSNSSDDWTSNGVILYDPVSKTIGVATIVIDLSVVGIDLVANTESVIVKRVRGNDTIFLTQSTGYNALPGDVLSLSVPAQNRGVLTSPATVMQVTDPDGNTIRGDIPALSPYTEGRVDLNWTVPENLGIGNQTLSFIVDPDENVTQDANRTNNQGYLDIFIGKAPIAQMNISDGLYTFQNITIDASSSFDPDAGNVECFFEIQDGFRVEYIDAPNCQTTWQWADDGDWQVTVRVVDDELDDAILTVNATVLNRAPYVNLTADVLIVQAGSTITFDASDSGDLDTISPPGQELDITWPGTTCNDDIVFGPTCPVTMQEEGLFSMEVVVTDDDGVSVSSFLTYEVTNVAPTLQEMFFLIDGIPYLPDGDGTWTIDEDIVATLSIVGDDTLSDREDLLITWYPDDTDMNWTETTIGTNSEINVSWGTSGLKTIKVVATDDDGETSTEVLGYVKVNNIAPDLGVLPAQTSLFEDKVLYLNSTAIDFADEEDLMFCWDVMGDIDSDDNGILTDDCDIIGNQLIYSWSTQGVKTITAIVWDDDNASDMFSIDVNIVNQKPEAKITVENDILEITEGDSITFSGRESSDTPTDQSKLVYIWDDPNTQGAVQDGFGINYTIKFDTPGTYQVNLTVTDDDGKSSTDTVEVIVTAKPTEGIFGLNNSTAIGGGMGVVILILLVIIVLRRRESSDDVMYEKGDSAIWNSAIQPQVEAPMAAPQNTSFGQGPPIPATGLPAGWSMEQWQHYGEQYLQQQSAPAAPQQPAVQPVPTPAPAYQPPPAYQQPPPMAQPPAQQFSQPVAAQPPRELSLDTLPGNMVQEPPPTPASQALSDLLDDLDL